MNFYHNRRRRKPAEPEIGTQHNEQLMRKVLGDETLTYEEALNRLTKPRLCAWIRANR